MLIYNLHSSLSRLFQKTNPNTINSITFTIGLYKLTYSSQLLLYIYSRIEGVPKLSDTIHCSEVITPSTITSNMFDVYIISLLLSFSVLTSEWLYIPQCQSDTNGIIHIKVIKQFLLTNSDF